MPNVNAQMATSKAAKAIKPWNDGWPIACKKLFKIFIVTPLLYMVSVGPSIDVSHANH
jgi:hypothetical protein